MQSRRRAALPDISDNKENKPPGKKKPKKPPKSANDLLRKSKSQHRTARDVLAPLPDGIVKTTKSPQPDFFQRFSTKRTHSHDDPLRVVPGFFQKINHDKQQEQALDTGYAGAARAYCEGAAAEAQKRVEILHAELAARRQGVDPDGRPLRRNGYPSRADFDTVFARMEDLEKPLEEEMIEVELHDAVTGERYFRQLRVGSTLDRFFERHARKRAAVVGIAREIRGVEEEISGLVEEVRVGKERMERGSVQMEEEMRELQREMEEAEEQYRAEMKALKRLLRAQSDEVNKKISDLKALVS